jgi:hypothetical protein
MTQTIAVALALSLATGAKTRAVHIMIDSDNPDVELQRLASVSQGYIGGRAAMLVTNERICKAPCDETVDVTDLSDFFVAGDGVTPSGRIELTGYGEAVNLKVKAGSAGRRIGGFMATIGGGSLALAGALFLGLGALSLGDTYSDNGGSIFFATGAITGAIGIAVLILGIVLLHGSGTDVEVSSAAGMPAPTGSTTAM